MDMSSIIVRVGSTIHITMQDVAQALFDLYRVDITWDTSRKRKVVTAKMLFCYYCFKYLKKNQTEIGRVVNLDRTTVVKHIKSCKGFIDIDQEEFVEGFNSLYKTLNQF